MFVLLSALLASEGAVKTITDYVFSNSWQLNELNMRPGDEYSVLADLCDLRQGEVVRFIGFDDVDNHYGIFVFIRADGAVLEVSGDFSGPGHAHLQGLRASLAKV
ncbi:hypothetical protein DBO85_14145 [Pseudomonas mangrovi]|uniref:Uncharacterized protein n=1 Tax=Pseudomonas mangrovi TaxID=2161748 RepID=A0A2T5P6X9_9PSED|nr:hypothetical protein DBO85_14145 [Pseudomonas mangrovi]